jgi:hypothetical protein
MSPASLAVDYDALNRVVAWFFPHWTLRRGRQSIFMWDPVRMLAAWSAGLLERNVWQKPSIEMNAVFVFSEFSRQLLVDSAYPMNRVFVVGVPLLDAVIQKASDPSDRAVLYAHLGLRTGDDFVLYNVEPSAEHHYADWDVHWRNFHAMMKAVTSIGMPVVLSLHPLSRLEDYAFAEREYGVKISRERKIYELYPHCRIAVSFACSTNLVAQIFCKPLVIYDFFDMASEHSDRADEFRLPGALVAHSAADIPALLHSAMSKTAADGNRVHQTNWSPASREIRAHTERLVNQRLRDACVDRAIAI